MWDEDDERDDINRFEAIETAISAINDIRAGRYADAITALERTFLPHWEDVAECSAAYREALALRGPSVLS